MNNTPIVQRVGALAELATQIISEHFAAESALQAGLERASSCGELLLAAKKLCEHGQWLPWLEKHCPAVGVRQAQKYMRLAKNWDRVNTPNANPDSHLPIDAALRELSRDEEQERRDKEQERKLHEKQFRANELLAKGAVIGRRKDHPESPLFVITHSVLKPGYYHFAHVRPPMNGLSEIIFSKEPITYQHVAFHLLDVEEFQELDWDEAHWLWLVRFGDVVLGIGKKDSPAMPDHIGLDQKHYRSSLDIGSRLSPRLGGWAADSTPEGNSAEGGAA